MPRLAERRDRRDGSRLLTCVYQATRNSGETTRDAARAVAEALGASTSSSTSTLVQGYVDRSSGRSAAS
jgi:NAD+ synthase (glutamine-hydrolysing)